MQEIIHIELCTEAPAGTGAADIEAALRQRMQEAGFRSLESVEVTLGDSVVRDHG